MEVLTELAIIGCGASGLSTAKIALQLGFTPTVFEKANSVGGLWRTDDGFVWKSLQTNVTKYTTSFSDFHWDNSSPLFPSAQQVQEYLEKYAIEHNLKPFIKFNSHVTHISYKSDNNNHHWEVTWMKNSQIYKKIFNYVVVCSGFFSSPYKPDHFNGFKGQVIHSSEYRSPELFKDQKVLVVGSSFSGADIAAEVAEVAKETYIAIKRPAYILPRMVSTKDYENIPLDLLFYNHKSQNDTSIPLSEPEKWQNKHNFLKTIGDTLDLTIDTNSPPFIVISDKFVEMVKKKKIVLCKALQRLDDNKAIFEDDGKDIVVDVVIFATGYGVDLSFFDKEFSESIGYNPTDLLQPLLLHETIFPEKFPNIAFVGLYRGPYFVINELQAHWACLVFSGKLKPPSETEIKEGIQHELKLRAMEKRPQFLIDYVEMADHLAKVVGVFPDELINVETIDPFPLWTCGKRKEGKSNGSHK